jgi:nitrogen fixation protein NifU and related proteins
MNDSEIYREYLLEHYKNPKNKGTIVDADITAHENNPLCGDSITIYAESSGGMMKKMKFEGSGCVISMASASILSENVEDKRFEDIKNMGHEQMLEMLGLKLTPTRVKCAMLALNTLKKGIEKSEIKSEIQSRMLENKNA